MKEISASLITEAAAWLALLHGPNRTLLVEQSLQRWLKASPDHARAFELVTEAWSAPLPQDLRRTRPGKPLRTGRPLALVGVLLAVAALFTVAFWYLRQPVFTTGIGEQRLVVLEDGSRLFLNTATRVAVSFTARQRTVELSRGEALFEVAKQPDRPFVVTVGNESVRAVGTAFVIRRDERQVAVTLIEGKVEVVRPPPTGTAPAATADQVLVPGERLTVPDSSPAKLDKPELARVLAWQRREVALDNTPITEALAEMNRYNTLPVVIDEVELSQLRISGLFKAGESLSFARAVAMTYQLDVRQTPDRILISSRPRTAR